jgi:hypothetical protein
LDPQLLPQDLGAPPGRVLLSRVLPDAHNISYQDQKYLVLDKVNGQSGPLAPATLKRRERRAPPRGICEA